MEFKHKSVLLEECIEHLKIKEDGVYVDGTIGGAGHSSVIYENLNSKGLLIGFDQDPDAIKTSQNKLENVSSKGKFLLFNTNFKNIKKVFEENNIEKPDGILLDLGVSSYQIDNIDRGFSYKNDANLDMRMDRSNELNAFKVVNKYSKDELKRIFFEYGEEKWSSRVADFIIDRREKNPINSTLELVDIIKAAIPLNARREGGHPAKRIFQAIRIEVNDELGILQKTMEDMIELLNPNGRLCIITFHSLEDRIVKNEFSINVNPCTCPPKFPICTCKKTPRVKIINKKPIIPSKEELNENSRSKSAKLRVVEKI